MRGSCDWSLGKVKRRASAVIFRDVENPDRVVQSLISFLASSQPVRHARCWSSRVRVWHEIMYGMWETGMGVLVWSLYLLYWTYRAGWSSRAGRAWWAWFICIAVSNDAVEIRCSGPPTREQVHSSKMKNALKALKPILEAWSEIRIQLPLAPVSL